jgi:NAD(P)-dependent dehydrogenase (short-subunit alcohol dehydrogenase family)
VNRLSDLRRLFDLKDKVIIVTGAVGLLGRKHVEAIAAFGGHPVLLDLSPTAVASFAEEINSEYGVNASGFSVDITDEDRIADNVVEVVKRYGKIDGLVNNAANNPRVEDNQLNDCSRLENFSLDNWNEDIAVGLTGSFLSAKYYGYQISKNSNGGVIVNISSDLGLIAPDQRLYSHDTLLVEDQPVKPVTYSVVKTGLLGLTRYLATYWADSNVRCNAICPGGVENGQSEAFIKEVSSRIPLGRLAYVEEYQGILVWMLGNAARYLNGAIIPVDGGRTTW